MITLASLFESKSCHCGGSNLAQARCRHFRDYQCQKREDLQDEKQQGK